MKTICCAHTGNFLVNILNYFVNTHVFLIRMDEIVLLLTPNEIKCNIIIIIYNNNFFYSPISETNI